MATQTEIAEHLDLSLRHTQRLIKGGKLPSSKGRGAYDIDACRIAYIRYLRGVSSGQVVGVEKQPVDDDDFSRLLEKEKYRKEKRQNDIEEKLVAPVSLLTDALHTAANQIVPIMESLPLVMKRNFPEMTGDQTILVKKAIAECLNCIADSKLVMKND